MCYLERLLFLRFHTVCTLLYYRRLNYNYSRHCRRYYRYCRCRRCRRHRRRRHCQSSSCSSSTILVSNQVHWIYSRPDIGNIGILARRLNKPIISAPCALIPALRRGGQFLLSCLIAFSAAQTHASVPFWVKGRQHLSCDQHNLVQPTNSARRIQLPLRGNLATAVDERDG